MLSYLYYFERNWRPTFARFVSQHQKGRWWWQVQTLQFSTGPMISYLLVSTMTSGPKNESTQKSVPALYLLNKVMVLARVVSLQYFLFFFISNWFSVLLPHYGEARRDCVVVCSVSFMLSFWAWHTVWRNHASTLYNLADTGYHWWDWIERNPIREMESEFRWHIR